MEDPVRFDIWAKPTEQERRKALGVLLEQGPYASELALRTQLAAAIREHAWLKLSASVAFSHAQRLSADIQQFTADVAVCQEGWEPGEKSHHCDEHDLYYGGSRGCHICSGFHISQVGSSLLERREWVAAYQAAMTFSRFLTHWLTQLGAMNYRPI
ncbi:hypothetical protein [Cupriavidus basilensis]